MYWARSWCYGKRVVLYDMTEANLSARGWRIVIWEKQGRVSAAEIVGWEDMVQQYQRTRSGTELLVRQGL